MPRGTPNPAQVPTPFLFRQAGRPETPYAVKQGERWRFANEICIQVHTLSVVDPKEGACLSGVGVVRSLKRGQIVITA